MGDFCSITCRTCIVVFLIVIAVHSDDNPTSEYKHLKSHAMVARSGMFSAITSYFDSKCGSIYPPEQETRPLRWSPWMVMLATVTDKGDDKILSCIATLIGTGVAITSHECLSEEKLSRLRVIAGSPNIHEHSGAYKKKVKNINVLLSERRIAVLNFDHLIISSSVRPICLERGDITGVYATLGWDREDEDFEMLPGVPESSIKVAYLKMKPICRTDGFCVDVAPATDYWEMEAEEVQEGAPFMVKRGDYWYIKGLMLYENIPQLNTLGRTDRNNETDHPLYFVRMTSEVVEELERLI